MTNDELADEFLDRWLPEGLGYRNKQAAREELLSMFAAARSRERQGIVQNLREFADRAEKNGFQQDAGLARSLAETIEAAM